MLLRHVILALGWMLFCVLHSVLASHTTKGWIRKKTGTLFRYYRLLYTLFALATLVAVVYYQATLSSKNVFRPVFLTTCLGGAMALIGLGLMIVCIRKYFVRLSGLKSLYQEEPSTELMIAGIHRFMRHPLYSGTFLAVWGFWGLFPTYSLLVADVIITVYTLYAIQLEEEKLVLEFGDKYRQYQKKVPKLIPRFRLAE